MSTNFTLDKWFEIVERGTSGDQVHNILYDWKADAKEKDALRAEVAALRADLENKLTAIDSLTSTANWQKDIITDARQHTTDLQSTTYREIQRLKKSENDLVNEIAALRDNLREWHMAWITDCIAAQPNGNVCNGTDEGMYLSCRMMIGILEKTRQLLREEA